MAEKPKKVALIGLDCALTHLIERHIAEGHLPTFKKLFAEGTVMENALAPFPTITPPNWATIATGAWAGTHGVTDFWVPLPGKTPNWMNTVEAFSSERVGAETIWDVADGMGKKSIVLNYPGAWPSKMKHGIMVGGAGLSIGTYSDGFRANNKVVALCGDQLVTNGLYPNAIRGEFKDAEDWNGVPEMGEDPLEMDVELAFPLAKDKPARTVWHILVRETADDGYDRLTLSPTKNFKEAFCTLSPGQWSPKIVTDIEMADGSRREVFFRTKLLELSDDAEDFRLYINSLGETAGWSAPPEIAAEIVSAEGTFGVNGGMNAYMDGWIDSDTYVEINDQYSVWLADAAVTLMKNHAWDLFCMHSHPTDWAYHALMTNMEKATCNDEAAYKEAWETHLRIYQTQDRMIARILEALDEDTLVILVSDHGATPDGPMFNPADALVPKGLMAFPESDGDEMAIDTGAIAKEMAEKVRLISRLPDPHRSKAMPQRLIYIYINLAGRDPEGIVKPEDYGQVQQEIIDALLTHVDPGTGKRPVALALAKEDARILGLYGDAVGDVVYAIYPEFSSQHGPLLPTARYGIGSLQALFTMTGPGIKKGARLERTAWLTDIVPTICYLMNWPLPAHTEGAVLYQAFEDPNFRFNEK